MTSAFRLGDLCVDRVTRNYCRVAAVDEDASRLKLHNPHYPIGWRDDHDVEGPFDSHCWPILDPEKRPTDKKEEQG